jgi:hypothetical protein
MTPACTSIHLRSITPPPGQPGSKLLPVGTGNAVPVSAGAVLPGHMVKSAPSVPNFQMEQTASTANSPSPHDRRDLDIHNQAHPAGRYG